MEGAGGSCCVGGAPVSVIPPPVHQCVFILGTGLHKDFYTQAGVYGLRLLHMIPEWEKNDGAGILFYEGGA